VLKYKCAEKTRWVSRGWCWGWEYRADVWIEWVRKSVGKCAKIGPEKPATEVAR